MRNIKVVVYPNDSGDHPLVTSADVRKLVDLGQYDELSISLCNITERDILPTVSNAIRDEQKVDIVFWNPIPEKDLEKLLGYNLGKINGVSLSSFNHNLKGEVVQTPKQKELSYEEKEERRWEDFFEKKKKVK